MLRRSLMLWTINPLNHHKNMHYWPCCVTRGRKMKRHWHSCWWTQQEGMLLHSSLSSLWVIREAACWRQLPCDLDILVSLSCWHNTLTVSWTSNCDWNGHLFETASSWLGVSYISSYNDKIYTFFCGTPISKLSKCLFQFYKIHTFSNVNFTYLINYFSKKILSTWLDWDERAATKHKITII